MEIAYILHKSVYYFYLP